jgi:hypothetical protein
MSRTPSLLTALIFVVAAAYVDGRWTQRWEKSPQLEAAIQRLDKVPNSAGEWQARPAPEIDPEELALAAAQGSWVKRYTSPNNDTVLVVLLVGRAGNLSVHRPENCYPGAGYDQAGTSLRFAVTRPRGEKLADCWTAKFVKNDLAAPSQLRIFWAWYAEGTWQASSYPRWDFAHLPYLYKLYVIRETATSGEPLEEEPAVKFLQAFLPELAKALNPS